jgi:hypothetical protein
LSAALLCAIDSATIENTFFEDDDDLKMVMMQIHFILFTNLNILTFKKKLLLIRCKAHTNMLAIILLRYGYFLKYL